MPFAGPADILSHALANHIVGNRADATAVEISLSAFRAEAMEAVEIAIAGASERLLIDGRSCEPCRRHMIGAGQTLEVGAPRRGCRTYLAIAGGLAVTDSLFSSGSTYLPAGLGGHHGRALRPGDILQRAKSEGATDSDLSDVKDEQRPAFGQQFLLRAVAGPELDRLNTTAQDRLFDAQWTIGRRANRIGVQLEGGLLHHDGASMASAAVFPGTIQLPPDGAPFLLGSDAQTTGGYPRVAQVIRADRHLIGQLRPGAQLRLVLCTPDRAREIHCQKLSLWRTIVPDIRLG